ncbi:MAG: GerMN domain-containing protein [Selenomonadaceae bacterium]|nr:GerMN domain-containing protein [Selenomonadaceae bacterium]
MKKVMGCSMKQHLKSCLVLVFVLMLSLVLTGCDDTKKAQDKSAGVGSGTAVKKEKNKPETQQEVTVYFPDNMGEKLLPVKLKIKGEAPAREMVGLLLQGPGEKERAAGMSRAFPKGVKLLGVTVKDKLAKVDFSKELTENFRGGSTGELMLAASLVNTLTGNPEIKKVKILVEGKEVESLSGHLDLTEPMERFKDF